MQAGFQRFYDTGVNSARLDSVAAILEQIVSRKLSSPESSDQMLFYLSDVHTSRNRILGKLPPGTKVPTRPAVSGSGSAISASSPSRTGSR